MNKFIYFELPYMVLDEFLGEIAEDLIEKSRDGDLIIEDTFGITLKNTSIVFSEPVVKIEMKNIETGEIFYNDLRPKKVSLLFQVINIYEAIEYLMEENFASFTLWSGQENKSNIGRSQNLLFYNENGEEKFYTVIEEEQSLDEVSTNFVRQYIEYKKKRGIQ